MIPLTPLGLALLSAALLAILIVPRRWAPVPLLIVACYMTLAQGVMLGPFNFFTIRLVILAGLIRIFIRGEFRQIPRSPLDRVMVVWSIWALAASVFRSDPGATLTYNGGMVFNSLGVYILLRVFCRSPADVVFLCRVVAWLLVPVALEMVYEKLATRNLFSVFGGVSEVPDVREGRIRAQGPFAHAILAGTVGAVMLPLCSGLWNRHRGTAILGTLASITMMVASSSSGPKMSAAFATLGLLLWPMRRYMGALRWTAVVGYLVLMVMMKSPPYYLMSRIDLSGGSTGWHRAHLIHTSILHLGEWWLAGTDYTRHWMPTGVPWSPNHTDITNHYLAYGVNGGLPLLLLFVLLIAKGFSLVGRLVRVAEKTQPRDAFFCWALGASLFALAASSLSVAYFDQSFLFLYLTLAAIAGFGASEHLQHAHRQLIPIRGRAVLGAIRILRQSGCTQDIPTRQFYNSPKRP
jgi:hypothetical protein